MKLKKQKTKHFSSTKQLLTEGYVQNKFTTWKIVKTLKRNAIIYTNDNTWDPQRLICSMDSKCRSVNALRRNESRWKPTTLHRNSMSYGQQAWLKANAVKSCVTWTRSTNSEFLWICGPACLMNVSRVHVGPVNGSSDVMKQLLRRGKWSVYLNRNVTTQ